jgi:hypothetical protein
MNLRKNLSTVQLLMLGTLVSLFWVGGAQAAPVYRGKFALPYAVHWGQAVLPAGEYRLRFEDVQTRVFVVIEEAKGHQAVALVSAMTVDQTRGGSA